MVSGAAYKIEFLL